MDDNIVTISTAVGTGAISIVRVTGKNSISIVNNIFRGSNLEKKDSHTINYGHIIYNDEIIDEVLVMLMKAPKTYTTLDTIEINCHGGIATTNKILEILLKNGCRLSEPGEFTKLAYLNGRIDLVEAEGVMDLINAKTDEMRKMAIASLSGSVSNLIRDLRENIVKILAQIEVNIDYPEYDDVEELETSHIIPLMNYMKKEMEKIIADSENGQILKEGIKTSIIGKPNVGKSSLLNALLEEDKAIVTNIAGTTRDTVEGQINLNGIILNIIDTAGIRTTDDEVEKIGVEKSLKLIDESDLIIHVLNNNEQLDESDFKIIDKLKNKNSITIVNKIDLETNIDYHKLNNIIKISILKNVGINNIKDKIVELFNLESIKTGDFAYLSNAREIALLKEAYESLLEVINGVNINMPIDMIEIDIKNIWEILGKILGESYEEELVDKLFSLFCLGK